MLRRFKGLPHKILNILRVNPCGTDTHLNLAGIQFLRLYLCKCLHIHGVFRVALCIDLCCFQFVTDISTQILIRCFPFIRQWVLKYNSCQLLLYRIHIFSGQLCHVIEINPCFFRQGYCQCFTCRIHTCDNLCLFNGTLREHIRFALEITLIVQFFQRTQQTIAAVLIKCSFVGLRVDQTVFLGKSII